MLGRTGTRDFVILKALAVIGNNIAKYLHRDWLREVRSVPSSLFSLFRDEPGLTPSIFWSSLRLEEAILQINRSHVSMASVASGLGFDAQDNITRIHSSAHRRCAERVPACIDAEARGDNAAMELCICGASERVSLQVLADRNTISLDFCTIHPSRAGLDRSGGGGKDVQESSAWAIEYECHFLWRQRISN